MKKLGPWQLICCHKIFFIIYFSSLLLDFFEECLGRYWISWLVFVIVSLSHFNQVAADSSPFLARDSNLVALDRIKDLSSETSSQIILRIPSKYSNISKCVHIAWFCFISRTQGSHKLNLSISYDTAVFPGMPKSRSSILGSCPVTPPRPPKHFNHVNASLFGNIVGPVQACTPAAPAVTPAPLAWLLQESRHGDAVHASSPPSASSVTHCVDLIRYGD